MSPHTTQASAPSASADSDEPGQDRFGVVTITGFGHRVLAILWPAFMMACVLEMLVFAWVDPEDLHWMGGAPIELSRSAVHTLAFLAFWLIISTAGALTQLLLADPGDVNKVRERRSAPHWPR
jgi:hypothetical protein